MKKIWVVVANSGLSKIYHAESKEKLLEIKTFTHIESHMHARELVSDRQGREANFNSYGSDGFEPKTSLKEKEAFHFAEEIALFLEKGLNSGECNRIYLIAKPPFLGVLRQCLNPHVAHLVQTEIHKDLTHSSPDEIREYLPPIL